MSGQHSPNAGKLKPGTEARATARSAAFRPRHLIEPRTWPSALRYQQPADAPDGLETLTAGFPAETGFGSKARITI